MYTEHHGISRYCYMRPDGFMCFITTYDLGEYIRRLIKHGRTLEEIRAMHIMEIKQELVETKVPVVI